MKRTPRLRWQAAAITTVAALTVAACSSNSSSSSSPGAGSSSSSSSAALTASAPGITPTQILIGSHQPLTGPAAPGYSEIAPASAAYFAYVNAHGGVYGRKIVYKYLDDGYNPTTTASDVRQLVLQDNVYAIFNGLGTPTHLAAVSFLNAQKVPDVFVASGCDCWSDPKYPQTFGWQLDYVREGKILGQYVKQHFAGKKVAFFYQNDEFGLDGVKGLSYEIPASMVVSKQSYVPTNVNIAPQVAALRASGAQVVVSFAIPAFTALLKLNCLKLGYSPTLVVSERRSDPITLVRAARGVREAGRGDRQRQPAHQRDHHRRIPSGAHGQRQLVHPVQDGARPVRAQGAARRQLLLRHGRRLHVRAGDAQGGQEPDPGEPGVGDRGRAPAGTHGRPVRLLLPTITWAPPAPTWASSRMVSWCSKDRS